MDTSILEFSGSTENPDTKYESDYLISNESGFQSPSNEVPSETRELRAALKFFFLNPIEKWHVKKRFPYKFGIQVIKIFLVTFQICIFARSRSFHMNYSTTNKVAFSHLFLKSWDASREVIAYPPEAGPLAIYQITTLIEHVDFAVQNYARINNSIGRFSYVTNKNHEPAPIHLHAKYIKNDNFIMTNDPAYTNVTTTITLEEAHNFSLTEFLKEKNLTINFQMLLHLRLMFELKAIVYKEGGSHCNKFDIKISFDNSEMDGQMLISLDSFLQKYVCNPHTLYADSVHFTLLWLSTLNLTVMLLCSISFILCLRALIKAQMLKCKTVRYFKEVRKAELSMEGRLEFWNFWYIMIIINDVLIITGSYMEGKISQNEYANEAWSICSLCLGTGNMLVWFGVLRYFGFFKTYNVVILTLKRAFPQMMRFLLCTLIIYAGFVFCGWLVLGPFHIKFCSISRTAENLFSLVNGDDMFATFTILDSKSSILWWYSRIYLYGFIILFIYVVLNLFLSVILDAYETIKEYYTHGYPKSDLQLFIAESDDDENEETANPNEGPCCFLKSIFCW